MSVNWEDCLGSQETKQGERVGMDGADVEALPPAALSKNPLDSPGGQRLSRCERLGVGTFENPRPAFWDYVYWAGWGVVGMACLVLAASVAKAIHYGVITDIINWMLGR